MPSIPTPRKPEIQTELFPLNVIRVETALSRFPVHRLAKRGNIAIEIREENKDGEVLILWEVSHNSRFGQPGPLAYKVETLIINRRIEESSRPIPEIIKLGSLHDICRKLGINGGKPRENVKTPFIRTPVPSSPPRSSIGRATGPTGASRLRARGTISFSRGRSCRPARPPMPSTSCRISSPVRS